MTQKYYIRNTVSQYAPSAGEKSTALPTSTLGANNASGNQEKLSLLSAKGSSQTSITIASDASTAARDNYIARATSNPLKAGTYGSGTWNINIATSEADANANSFFVGSIYFWRPSTGAVVGFVYDSHTAVGVEWATTEDGLALTVTGSNVTILDGDVLVFEVWRSATQAMALAYNQIFYYDGATDVVDSTTTDAASYISAPADIPETNSYMAVVADYYSSASPAGTPMGNIANIIQTERQQYMLKTAPWARPRIYDFWKPVVIPAHWAMFGLCGTSTLAVSTTNWFAIGNGRMNVEITDENRKKTPMRTAGIIRNVTLKATANGTTGASTLTIRKNGADAGISISIPAGSTSLVSDDTNSVAFVAGDLLSGQIVVGAGTSGMSVAEIGGILEVDPSVGKTLTKFMQVVARSVSSSTDLFTTLSGDIANSTETNCQLNMRADGTLKNLAVFVSANTRTTAGTVKSRKGGADGAISLSVPSSTANTLVEDTTNSDAVAVGDLFNLAYNAGAGTGAFTLELIAIEFLTTDSKFIMPMQAGGGVTVSAGVTQYASPAGWLSSNATESNRTIPSRQLTDLFKLKQLVVHVSANTDDGASTITARIASSDSALSVSIPSSSGATVVTDTTNSPAVLLAQDLAVKIASGGATGSLSLRSMAMVGYSIDPALTIVAKTVADTIAFTQAIYRGKSFALAQSFASANAVLVNKGLIIANAFSLATQVVKVGKNLILAQAYSMGNQLVTVNKNLKISQIFSGANAILVNKNLKITQLFTSANTSKTNKDIKQPQTFTMSNIAYAGKNLKLSQALALAQQIIVNKNLKLAQTFISTNAIIMSKNLKILQSFTMAQVSKSNKDIKQAQTFSMNTVAYIGKNLKLSQAFSMAQTLLKSNLVTLAQALTFANVILANKNLKLTQTLSMSNLVKVGKNLKLAQTFSMSTLGNIGKNLKLSQAVSFANQLIVNKNLKLAQSYLMSNAVKVGKNLKIAQSLALANVSIINKNLKLSQSLTFAQTIIRNKTIVLAQLFSMAQTVTRAKVIVLSQAFVMTTSSKINKNLKLVQTWLGSAVVNVSSNLHVVTVSEVFSLTNRVLVNKNLKLTNVINFTAIVGNARLRFIRKAFTLKKTEDVGASKASTNVSAVEKNFDEEIF